MNALAFVTAMILAAVSMPARAQQPSWPPPVAPEGFMQPGPGWPPAVVDVKRPLPGKDFKEGFVDTDGWHIRYIEAGKGPITVVSFPGSGGLEISTAKDILAKKYRDRNQSARLGTG